MSIISKYILIDDDKIISLSWTYRAKEKNIELFVFSSADDFFEQHSKFDKKSHIFIDSVLGDNIRGEIESRRIFELGFENIFLTTGFTDFDISNYPWIRGAISKKPPF